MADSVPTPGAAPAPDDQRPTPPPPPPLKDIRVKGPGSKGLNKPAIILTAGGGIGVILLLASNSMSGSPAREPANTRPMMSGPARPEMAPGAIRQLPSTYSEAAAREAARQPAPPPQLGPPLAGDVAAFAPDAGYPADDWSAETQEQRSGPPDPAVAEAQQADRSQIFFQLRQETARPAPDPQLYQPPRGPLTAIGPAQPSPLVPAQSDHALFPGTVIPASLITSINSESPGSIVAQVTQTVYDSRTGRVPIIPQGARLMGDYKSSARYGQTRIAIGWSRLVMPDGTEVQLEEAATDPSGAAGVPGQIDNHWPEVFGAAVLGTIINIGVATTEDPALTFGGVGAVSRDPVDSAMADGIQRGAGAVSARVVDRSLAVPPTIRVEAGKRVSVIVTKGLSFSD